MLNVKMLNVKQIVMILAVGSVAIAGGAAEAWAGGVLPATDGVGVGLFYERPRRTMRADNGQRHVLEYDHVGIGFAGNVAVALTTPAQRRHTETDFQYGIGAGIRNYRETRDFGVEAMGYVGAGVPLANGALILGFSGTFNFSYARITDFTSTTIDVYNFSATVFTTAERFEFFFYEIVAAMMVSYWSNRDPHTGDFTPLGAVVSIGYTFDFIRFESEYHYRDILNQSRFESAGVSSTNNHFLLLSLGLSIGLSARTAIVPLYVNLFLGDHTYFLVGIALYL